MPGMRNTGFRNNFYYWSAHQGSITYNDADNKFYYSGGAEASWGEARGYLFRWSDVNYNSNGKEAISFLNAVSANSNSTSLVLFGYQSNKLTNTWKYIQYNTNTLKCYIPYTNIEYNTNSVEQDDGILDGIQTSLDVAGIADPTGIVDGINALIYAGRGQLGNAAISALAIIPYVGDIGKAGRLGAKTLQLTSKARTAENGLELAGKFLKPGYTEIAPGVFRSSDQLRQFRMTDADILGLHGKIGPHFNYEILDINGNFIKNYHVPLK